MWPEWTAYVACSLLYVTLLRSLTTGGLYEMNGTMYIFGAELFKLLFVLCIYFSLPDANAGVTLKQKWRSLGRNWREGSRFVSVGIAFAVFSATVVLDVARMRPPLHRLVLAVRPLITAALLQYTTGDRLAWNGRQWLALGLVAAAGAVLPINDWYAGESVYHAVAIAVVALAEVAMFSGANCFLEHLLSKRRRSKEQGEQLVSTRASTNWQQAVYLFAASTFIAFCIFHIGTPKRFDELYLYWATASWTPYFALGVGGACGVCQVLLLRAGGCLAKELALTAVVIVSAAVIQLSGSIDVVRELNMVPLGAAVFLLMASTLCFVLYQPTTRSSQL